MPGEISRHGNASGGGSVEIHDRTGLRSGVNAPWDGEGVACWVLEDRGEGDGHGDGDGATGMIRAMWLMYIVV